MKFAKRLQEIRERRKRRVRSVIRGTALKPRLSVFRSNTFTSAQLIDDATGKTLISVSSRGTKEKMTKITAAAAVGKSLAERAVKAGISTVVFDRGSYRYHGRVKALADAARKSGLTF